MKHLCYALIYLLAFSFSAIAVAEAPEDKLGQVFVDEVLLRPQFFLQEPFNGEFSLGESLFTVGWRKNANLAAQISLGELSLRNAPIYYSSEVQDDLGIIEAYALYSSVYGELRMGLVPVEFGIEGGLREAQLKFPRSLLFNQRVIGLRDYGISYKIKHNGYFTGLVIHNGESDSNSDGRIWYTAKWGWSNEKDFTLMVAGQAGTTKSEITSSSANTLAGVNNNEDANWWTSLLGINWKPGDWEMLLEGYSGQVKQDIKPKDHKESFWGAHLDLNFDVNDSFRIQTRYDHLEPNQGLKDDTLREVSLGLAFKSQHSSSVVYLIGTKVLEEKDESSNDELRLIWQLSPLLF